MRIINGIPHSLYFVFIKGLIGKTDKEILQMLGLDKYEKIELANESDFDSRYYIYISRDTEWVHIMESWCYSFRCLKTFPQRIEELSKANEIFVCSVGDCDRSHEFKYYNGGKKIREFVVESPSFKDEVITVNEGAWFISEKIAMKEPDVFKRVIYIAMSLGIQLPSDPEQISCYKILNLDKLRV